MEGYTALKELFIAPKLDKALLNQTKKEKNTIYGARSIQAQIGIFSRYTEDWDILSSNPKKSAMKTEKKFDSIWGGNQYFVKPAQHPGTYKVMSKGMDGKKNTKDDFGVVDYTGYPKPKPPVKIINGIRYRTLTQEKKAKIKALKDKAYAFRHQKDREDLNRVKLAQGKKVEFY